MSTQASDPYLQLLRLLTMLVVAMVALAAYVVCDPSFDFPTHDGPRTCDPGSPDDDQCEPGDWCMHEVCTPRAPLCRAQRGELCHECDCDVSLTCRPEDLRCHPEGEVVAAPTCADPVVRAAIERLTDACRQRKRSVQAQAEDDAGCSADDWRQLLADNAEVGNLLAAFPDRFAVYFPINEPRRGHSWPGASANVIDRQFAAHAESLRTASAIFIIGRATPDGRPSEDQNLAVRRLNAVERILEKVLHGDKPPSERTAGPTLISWGTRGERPIPLDAFIRNFAGVHPPLAVNQATSDRLAAALAGADALSPAQRDALEREVNRVALIIPIHCALEAPQG